MTFAEKTTIPIGNTLICLPLNSEAPIRPQIFECKSVNDVFLFIKPSCSIGFKGYSQKLIEEKFVFSSLTDFNVTTICSKSDFLNSLIELCLLYFENMHLDVPGDRTEKINFILQYISLTEEDKLMKCFSLLKKGLIQCVKIFSPIEKGYREIDLFFKNKITDGKIFILHAFPDQLFDLDNDYFPCRVENFIRDNYDKLDLRNAISSLVIPAFIKYNMVLYVYARICMRNGVMLFTDLNEFEDETDKNAVISTYNPASASLDFSDSYNANVCLSADQLFIYKGYSFLDEVVTKLSCSTIIAGLIPSFVLTNPVTTINLQSIYDRVKLVSNNGRYKSSFNSFSVEKKNVDYVTLGNETLYTGSLNFQKKVKHVLLCNWLLKRFLQLLNITIINQLEVFPPGNLQLLQKNFAEKISMDFYSLCRQDKEKMYPNVEWLLVIPNWIKVITNESFKNCFLWPTSFSLIIKLKDRKQDDDLLLMHIRIYAKSEYSFESAIPDIRYEEIAEEELINFADEIPHEFY